ncbi:PREDICTED: regulation of nuclear pre-mRNA domain-containing protein 1B-like isoform X1 [Branchiostoma belcheri]|uniref:Regulation of nuclear pre-mRNA domain-containing protein 1B-like isoform X1 n=1 Tax=Branchiostoma belcheri TaxID=7741 RepID=A0A6P4ZA42_BRABE|nr:PREDICTED: regulation of nuclear pre-mRNA domain-containing protein 1B-like isoform X1 [Branchiostoma belcheri]
MTSFSESALERKLSELSNSQQSIQTLSLWLIHHRKHHKLIVQTWQNELHKAKPGRKLTFMYLANDVIQNSKKKGPEFTKEFTNVLVRAFQHVARYTATDDDTVKRLERIVDIWKERAVYDADYVDQLKRGLHKRSGNEDRRSPVKKKKVEPVVLLEEEEEEEEGSPREPPEPEELMKALEELEHSASSDAAVREKIANLPPEVQDVSMLEKIQADRDSAEKLSKMVDEACMLLAEYNGRLAAELEDRKHVSRMLKDFVAVQKEKLAQSEEMLSEYKTKLAKVTSVRKELKSHLQNLPDLTLLPDVTGGLAPLPSAGDLFSSE